METQVYTKEEVDINITLFNKLVLFNSNHLWDDVIVQLKKATGFDTIQCEQIAIIAHTNGKAIVKSGNFWELENINTVLKEINLKTKIM